MLMLFLAFSPCAGRCGNVTGPPFFRIAGI
jgi:hypothetical protein